MTTLSKGQRLAIETEDGRRVVMTVVQIKQGSVRLGFAGPPEVPINRSEVQAAIEWRRGTPSEPSTLAIKEVAS